MESIAQKIQNLPPDLQDQANDFIEFLINKKKRKARKTPKLDWVGGLRQFKNQYSALELQKKALDWRK
jgi:hypothetical protein